MADRICAASSFQLQGTFDFERKSGSFNQLPYDDGACLSISSVFAKSSLWIHNAKCNSPPSSSYLLGPDLRNSGHLNRGGIFVGIAKVLKINE